MGKDLLEEGWNTVFAKYVDLNKDCNIVSTEQIKTCINQDLRLMIKLDTYESQPSIFKDNGLVLIPLKNGGDYAIVKGKSFENITYSLPKIYYSRLGYELDTLEQGVSESQHLDYAFHTGLIEYFLNTHGLCLTIRGRKYTPEFDFHMGKSQLKVSGVQFEVDAGFQNESSIALIEGKVGKPSNFNIKQMFYPYRSWKIWRGKDKKIYNILFVYNHKEDTYGLWLYEFSDDNDYESIKLVKNEVYKILNQKDMEEAVK